ncbi:unnamed protein product [Allacma fusca]|uniref:Uncharacterized protein n=1 Tax=Allacma fusca TaxID=39272 RepID=A0A8J2LEY8_9HEXA|nr:unnamed protein product [Allacma fusca]
MEISRFNYNKIIITEATLLRSLYFGEPYILAQPQTRSSGRSPPNCEYEVFQVSPENIEDKSSIVKLGTSDFSGCSRGNWQDPIVPRERDWLEKIRIACHNNGVHISLSANSNTKMRIKCEAARPVDMKFQQHQQQNGRLPYSGMNVKFSAKIPSRGGNDGSSPIHQIEVEFPDVISIENESLDSFRGTIYFFEIDSPNTTLHAVQLSLTKIQGTSSPLDERLHLDTSNGRALCETSGLTLGTEIYFVGIDGDNPRESELKRACLQRNIPCPNKVIGTGCVQDRFCQKIALNLFNNGILSCQVGINRAPIEKSFFTGLDVEIHDVPAQPSTPINSRFLIQVYKDDDEVVKDILSEFPSGDNAREINEDEKFENRRQAPIHVTDGERQKFECHFVSYILIHPIIWEVTFTDGSNPITLYDYGNGTSIEYRQVEGFSGGLPDQVKIKSSKVEIPISKEMKTIRCSAFYWNSNIKASSSRGLKMPKKISDSRDTKIHQNNGGRKKYGREDRTKEHLRATTLHLSTKSDKNPRDLTTH